MVETMKLYLAAHGLLTQMEGDQYYALFTQRLATALKQFEAQHLEKKHE
jgi:hypothetical protein